jgi:hypothetical protein
MRRRRARVGNGVERGSLRRRRSPRGAAVTASTDLVLATFPRRRNGNDEQVRVQLARVADGTPLLQLRRWYRVESGEWRPTREGVAIKVSELRDLEAAIGRARDVLNDEPSAPTTATSRGGQT